MGAMKELWKTAILLLVVVLLFIFQDSVNELPRWVGPIIVLGYFAHSTSKHIGKLEKRIAWLEENTVRRQDL